MYKPHKRLIKIAIVAMCAWGSLCLSWLLDTNSAYALEYNEINENTIVSSDYLSGSIPELMGNAVETTIKLALQNPVKVGGVDNVKIPKYEWIDGKFNLKYTEIDGVERSVLVRCCICITDFVTTSDDYITGSDGLKYLLNVPYFSIYRSDGYYKRYYIYNSRGNWSSAVYTDYITLSSPISTYNQCYDVTDGSLVGSAIDTNFSVYNLRFYKRDVNSIVITPFNMQNTPTGYPVFYWFSPSDSTTYQPLPFPIDKAFYTNRYGMNFGSGSSSPSRALYCYPKFYLSWIDTNDSTVYNNLVSNDTYNINNYSYNTTYPANTYINHTNSNDFLNGILNNYFDVDGNLKPDIDFKLPLDMDLSDLVPDLVTNITNRFGDMPDLELPWDSSDRNNYYDIDLPSPDVPDVPTVSGWISPKYPAITGTAVLNPAIVEFSTADIPENLMTVGTSFLSRSLDVVDCIPNYLLCLGIIFMVWVCYHIFSK